MIGLTAAAPAAVPALTALETLERGEWELKTREPGDPVRRLCMGDPRQLLQIRHSRSACSRFVVKDSAEQVIVTYDCAAAGNGRTELRVETPRLVQIQSQGVADSAPFSFTIEARRTGACHR